MATTHASSNGSRVMRWSVADYHRAAESGVFDRRRVELIDGEIIEMSPQGNAHAVGIGKVDYALRTIFGSTHWIRIQMPLTLGTRDEPEPDIAVVRGTPDEYSAHPNTALLVVEISDSTLAYDRGEKANLYAAHGIADYWIVNLADRCVEVLREPTEDRASPTGWRHASRKVVRPGEALSPLAVPGSSIAAASLIK